jgi:O-antigen/teichoic acid export membrane protein
LEAQSKFKQVNLVRIPMGVLTFLGPAMMSLEYESLAVLVITLVIVRVFGLVALAIVSETVFPLRMGYLQLRLENCSRLLTFSGWLAVTNVVSPIMTYCDRFLIASLLSLSAVAIYSTVFDAMLALLMVPAALVGVSFPMFCTLRAQGAERDLRNAYARVTRNIASVLVPVLLIMVVFADQILGMWLGHDFAQTASPIARILAVGILANGLAHAPSVLLHAAKRPDLTAKLHLLELPIYIGLLSFLLSQFGIEGAALAWVTRVCVDAIALFFFAHRELSRS